MSKNKSKRYWRAEVTFAHGDAPGKAKTSQVLGTKRENCEDCVKELEHFLHTYVHNEVTSIGIFKRYD